MGNGGNDEKEKRKSKTGSRHLSVLFLLFLEKKGSA